MNGLDSFGTWVKLNRRAMGLTQEEFARTIYCACITLRKIESNQLRPSRELAYTIVDRMGVPAEEREAMVRWARERNGSLFVQVMGHYLRA